MNETDEKPLYGRSIKCAECGCDDPDKLSKTVRDDLVPGRLATVEYEAIECARCGSVTAL